MGWNHQLVVHAQHFVLKGRFFFWTWDSSIESAIEESESFTKWKGFFVFMHKNSHSCEAMDFYKFDLIWSKNKFWF